jgi:hypothetical protein
MSLLFPKACFLCLITLIISRSVNTQQESDDLCFSGVVQEGAEIKSAFNKKHYCIYNSELEHTHCFLNNGMDQILKKPILILNLNMTNIGGKTGLH